MIRFSVLTLIAGILISPFGLPRPAVADTQVKFTVTAKSAYARIQPDPNAAKSFSIFQGQTYTVLAQDNTRTWVRLKIAAIAQAAWVPVSYGTLSEDLSRVPLDTGNAAPQLTPAGSAPAPSTPASSPTPAGNSIQSATSNLKFTLTVQSAYARSGPDLAAAKLTSLFKGQSFNAIGRDLSSSWIQIILKDGSKGWVLASSGKLSGHILSLAVAKNGDTPVDPTAPGSPTPVPTPPASMPEWIPVITPQMRKVYEQAEKNKRDPLMFTVAGDCNSEDPWYREYLAYHIVELPDGDYLRPTVDRLYNALLRKSLAARGSFTATSMLEPLWADPRVCEKGEGPLACELRLTRASVVFIGLGTGDHLHGRWEFFEENYRPVIEYTLSTGALPVLITKADMLETLEGGAPPDYLNSIVRRLGKEYGVPVFDLALGAKTLYNGGLVEEPGNDFHLNFLGYTLRNLGIFQIMYLLMNPDAPSATR